MNLSRQNRPLKSFLLSFSGFLFLIFLSFSSCRHEETILGDISFTSNEDSRIHLFDSNGRQIDNALYEVGKSPFIVQMKSSGVFIVHAVSEGKPAIQNPLTFVSGSLDYFIEF